MTSKTAGTVTGDKIKFEELKNKIIPVSLNGITKKLKVFVLKNTENLFGSDWFQKFNLWDQPINTFCQKVECITTEAEKLRWNKKVVSPKYFLLVLVLCFDLLTRPKMPFKVMHRKEVTHSNGS